MTESPKITLAQDEFDFQILLNGWTLKERLEIAKGKAGKVDEPQVQRMFQAWKEAVAPVRKDDFEKRLSWSDLSIEEAAWALKPPRHSVPSNPPWFKTLQTIRCVLRESLAREQNDAQWLRTFTQRYQPYLNRHIPMPCEEIWYPVLEFAWLELDDKRDLGDNQTTYARNELLAKLLGDLNRVCGDILAMTFTKDRGLGESLLVAIRNIRHGVDTNSTKLYSEFIFREIRGGLSNTLTCYPVLGRLIAMVFINWRAANGDFLYRLSDSRSSLDEHFGIPKDKLVCDFSIGKGDPHRGGQTVNVVTFEGGDKIVYKPKCLEIEHKFHELVRTCTAELDNSSLRLLQILPKVDDSGHYGWAEFAHYAPAETEEDLQQFYVNAGRMLAILYLVGATDCHSENLLACKDQLILVDVETILEGDGPSPDEGYEKNQIKDRLEESVLRIGILPQWIFNPSTNSSYDISALGMKPAALESLQVPGWCMTNTDAMFRGYVDVFEEHPQSSPVSQGYPNVLTSYSEEFMSGLEEMFEWVSRVENKNMFTEKLDHFTGVVRRFVCRATRVYGGISAQSLKPDALRNRLLHDFRLEKLSRGALLSPRRSHTWRLFEQERSAMEQLDIPFFEHSLGSRDLPLDEGDVISDYFGEDGVIGAKRRVKMLDREEIQWQCAIADASLQCRQISMTKSPGVSNRRTTSAEPRGDFLSKNTEMQAEAISTASKLMQGCLGQPANTDWLGLQLMPDGMHFKLGLIGPSLYDGKIGIALFLAYTSMFAQEQERHVLQEFMIRLIHDIMNPLDRDSQKHGSRVIRNLGFGINGFAGILLALLQIDTLFSERPLFSKHIQKMIELLEVTDIKTDNYFDLMLGASGAIGPLLRYFRQSGDQRGLSLAKTCGDHVLAHQQADSGAWLQGIHMTGKPLTGWSHGAGGIAAALAALANASGKERYLAAAEKATLYETDQFDQIEGNWPDYRDWSDGSDKNFMTTWCHGAPGIALSRCLLSRNAPDSSLKDKWGNEFSLALDHMLNAMPLVNDHLCCGELGIVEILMAIAQITGDVDVKRAACQRSDLVFSRCQSSGNWSLLLPPEAGLHLPGLFTGIAGIGYHLLRQSDPNVVEDISTLGLMDT